MAWPCTAAMDTRSLRRHQVNASWYSAMVASSLGLRATRHVEERRLAVETFGSEGLPVEARGEGHALAAEHHDPDRARQRPSGLGQRPPQSGRLSVALGRIGERHRGDGVVDGEPYAVLVEHSVERGHGAPPDGVQSALGIK